MIEPDRVDQITQITTYAADGIAMLPSQLRPSQFSPAALVPPGPPVVPVSSDLPAVAALLGSWLMECQAVETALWGILTETLDTAVGVGLDMLGSLLAYPRDGLDDATYRLRLRVQILVLKSNGHPNDIVAVVRQALVGSGCTATYTEVSGTTPLGATAVVEVHGALSDATAAALESFLRAAKAVGTRVLLIYSGTDDADTFTFSADLTSPTDTTRGWGDSTDATVGGKIASVFA